MEDFFFHHWLSHFISGTIGFLLGWFLKPNNAVAGDLNVEGEARLRAEADELRAKLRALEGNVQTRDTEISDLKGKLAAAAAGAGAAAVATKAASSDKDDEETYALEWRNRYLAARVKYLEGRLSEVDTAGAATAVAAGAGAATLAAKKKPAKKKTPAKTAAKPKAKAGTTTATKAATARKKPGPKPGTKRGTTNKDGSARKKPGPKPAAKKVADPVDKYLEKVRVYEKSAKRDVVASVVKYCGVSLKNRDTSLVACSDIQERERIAKGFAKKKLGLNKADADALIAKTCLTMKGTRQKSRVTFYYLMARDAGKLDVFGG